MNEKKYPFQDRVTGTMKVNFRKDEKFSIESLWQKIGFTEDEVNEHSDEGGEFVEIIPTFGDEDEENDNEQ